MNTRHIVWKCSALAAAAAGVWQLAASPAVAQGSKKATATFSVSDLAKRKGPNPPEGSTFMGVQDQPMVGEVQLPLHDARVYKFESKTTQGKTIPVNWAYAPGSGTYMWGTTTIKCAGTSTIEQAGFAMQVHDDGTGAYILGTSKCPVKSAYGCKFDSQARETDCGLCAWSESELNCVRQ